MLLVFCLKSIGLLFPPAGLCKAPPMPGREKEEVVARRARAARREFENLCKVPTQILVVDKGSDQPSLVSFCA